jgi:hypothetical protein
MGNNAGQMALLAAGYLLGKSKNLRTVLLVAGGVAYGRLTAPRKDDEGASESLLSRFGSSGFLDAARDVVTTTASKGVESLNKNLQGRTEELRNQNGSRSDDSEQGSEESSESTESTESGDNSDG